MRVACLLLMGLVPLFACCQSTSPEHLLIEHPYDTLSKYSYLIITYTKSFGGHTPHADNGTGFFIRQDKKLFLVSAAHVLTGCPVYKTQEDLDTTKYDRPDVLKIWYTDRSNQDKYVQLTLKGHKKPCVAAYNMPDVAVIDVTSHFKNEQINSIEQAASVHWSDSLQLQRGDTVVGYGFSTMPQGSIEFIEGHLPKRPEAYVRFGMAWSDRGPGYEKANMAGIYHLIEPELKVGASGAPIFRITTKGVTKAIEFIGIQSGSDSVSHTSTIVQRLKLGEELGQLKKNR